MLLHSHPLHCDVRVLGCEGVEEERGGTWIGGIYHEGGWIEGGMRWGFEENGWEYTRSCVDVMRWMGISEGFSYLGWDGRNCMIL